MEAETSPAMFYVLTGHISAPKIYTLNLTTLALTGTVDLASYDTISATSLLTGYHDGPQDRFVTFFSDPGPTSIAIGVASHDVLVRHIHSSSGGTLTAGNIWMKRGMSVCTRPFLVGSRWCIIGQFDDGSQHAQGCYVLLDVMTTAILGRALYGEGGDVGQRAAFTAGGLNFGTTAVAVPEADRVRVLLNGWDGTQYVAREVTFIFDETLGPLLTARPGEETAIPGAWPLHVCGGEVIEYMPIYPHIAPVLAAVDKIDGELAAGYYGGCYLYVLRDSAGNLHRSAPSPVATVHITTTGKNIEWTVDKLRMSNHPEVYAIELYLTGKQTTAEAAGVAALYLQYAVPNDADPTVNVLQFTMAQSTVAATELLYSFEEGELTNDAAPPFRASFAWRDRLILLDTDSLGDVWVSKEKQIGRGYSFSVDLAFTIAEAGRVYAGAAVDFNGAAIFGEHGIWVISGPGPDSQAGNGQYQPTRVPGYIGAINPRSLCTTPAGLIFQATDGRWWLLPIGSLQLVDIGAGVESYRGRTVAATMWDRQTQHVRVHLEPEE
jgi:hypothetical protein